MHKSGLLIVFSELQCDNFSCSEVIMKWYRCLVVTFCDLFQSIKNIIVCLNYCATVVDLNTNVLVWLQTLPPPLLISVDSIAKCM